ncbi:MAG: DUF4435 domain-containing protein [Flavobacteriales bacterium]|jgi:hypothetical protein
MENGFPTLTDSFLAGQDILYSQFNDVYFYVEDTEQEHLYFNIFKRLFPDISFDKIFPLNGKANVKNHAKDNIGDKSKVYIADIDFDDILNNKEEIENVFYLNKYSIENYFVDKKGVYELIREKNPKLKKADIDSIFDFNNQLKQSKILLSELACTFIVIQKHSLGKEYFGLNPARDFNLQTNPVCYKNNFISQYFTETELLVKGIDQRFTLNSKRNEFKQSFNSVNKSLKNIPGKYLINLLKYQLEQLGLINQVNNESFIYKLSKECNVTEFDDLKIRINNYVN